MKWLLFHFETFREPIRQIAHPSDTATATLADSETETARYTDTNGETEIQVRVHAASIICVAGSNENWFCQCPTIDKCFTVPGNKCVGKRLGQSDLPVSQNYGQSA